MLTYAVVSRLVDDLGLLERVFVKLKAADADKHARDAARNAYRHATNTSCYEYPKLLVYQALIAIPSACHA
jgi:hypothetical protein